MTDEDPLYERLQAFVGQPATPVRHAQDAVNGPMIRHFVEAIGDENPVYVDAHAAAATGRAGIVAPPTMLPVWLMVGYRAHQAAQLDPPADTATARLLALLGEAGFTGVVATNDEQTYHRELSEGDRLSMQTVIVEISPRKQTALGAGYFITTERTYIDQDGKTVAEQRFRILRFNPALRESTEPPANHPAFRPEPFITRDNEFWFAAARERRLVIQACSGCGKLRHPPSPSCPHCRCLDWHEVTASGRGRVHSYVVSHHPKAPGFDYPLTVVLVDLEEGTRLVADYVGDPAEVAVGLAVEVDWLTRNERLTLPRVRARREEQ